MGSIFGDYAEMMGQQQQGQLNATGFSQQWQPLPSQLAALTNGTAASSYYVDGDTSAMGALTISPAPPPSKPKRPNQDWLDKRVAEMRVEL